MAKGIPRVALLVETSLGYGRALLRGVMRYARLHGPWAFYLQPGDLRQLLPKMEEWSGTGIIARIETPEVARAVLAARLPTIALDLNQKQLDPKNPLSRLSEVRPDSHKAGRLAAEHLLERGFRNFAFVGVWGDFPWSMQRSEGLRRTSRRGGTFVQRFPHAAYNARPPLGTRTSDIGRMARAIAEAAWHYGLRRRPGPPGFRGMPGRGLASPPGRSRRGRR